MATRKSAGGMGSSNRPSRRTVRRLASAAAGCVDFRLEVLESRVLLSAAPGGNGLLEGPVSSAATATWYRQRVAQLQSLQATHVLEPDYQISRSGQSAPLQSAAPDPTGLTPAQLDKFYGFTGLSFGSTPADGRGQTIALIDAYNDPDIAGDLKTFDTAYGLAAPPSFKVVSQTGSSTALPGSPTPDPVNGSWASEESLDVEWAHALAPGANILLVECNSQTDQDLFTGAAYAASAPGVCAVSMSFGLSEATYTTAQVDAIDPTFATPPGHQGVTFFASSGDDGAFSDGGPLAVSFPSSSPFVVSVGGTTIETNSSGTPVGETAWAGSGGGTSVLEPQTAAQRAAVGPYSGRANPDVSFDADPDSGVNVCDSFDFSAATPFVVFGGTSFSSPAWASILAITNQGRVAAGRTTFDGRFQTIPDLYAAYTNGTYSSVFKDITSGNNGFYSATKGYDLVTGLGSPTVNALVPELAANAVEGAAPTIGSFATSPDAENTGTPITLTASNVTDTAGNVTGVDFFKLKGAVSTLLGAATLDASGNWALPVATTGLAAGTYTYTAVAINNFKQKSPAVSAMNKVVVGQATPTIATFYITPGKAPIGASETLNAIGVADTTSTIASVSFYLQSGTTQTPLGNGVQYEPGRWDLTAPTSGLTPGVYTYAAIATAASGLISKPSTATSTITLGPPVAVVINTVKDRTDPKGSKTVSLRDAVGIADAATGPVTIAFDPTVFGKFQTIVLTGSTLSLTNAVAPAAIDGPAAGVAISGNGLVEVFSVSPGAVVALSNVTITDGATGGNGGGLSNAGYASLSHVTVSDSVANGLVSNGGGIENDGTLSLIDSVITGNAAVNGDGGGLNNTGELTASGTTISGNSALNGGGVGNYGYGTAAFLDSTISGNSAVVTGGGIQNYGSLTLASSTVSGNSANYGGGLYNGVSYDSSTGSAALTNCTVADNSASSDGGGIINRYSCNLTLSDSTLSRNAAAYYGGVDNSGTTTVANSIIAGNIGTDSSDGQDVNGAFTSKGHNLIGESDGGTGWVSSDYTGTVASPLAAELSLLGNFKGPTQTLVPLTGSPALGHGATPLIPSGVTTDQRGDPRVVGGKVDIGSVEVQRVSPITVTAPAPESAVAGKSASFNLGSFSDPLTRGPFTVVVDWGDGSTDTAASLGSTGTIGAQIHSFDAPGTFVVSFVVADASGNVSNLGTFSVEVAPAPLATITVNTTKDKTDPAGSPTVSLRDAVSMADDGFGPVTIRFDPKVFAAHQTLTLDGNDLEITDTAGEVAINGPAAGVTISGAGLSDVLFVGGAVTASLTNLAIVDGANTADAGGIINLGTLEIADSTISGNVSSGGTGGAIDNDGTLTMINGTLSGNIARHGELSGSGEGGALYNYGTATLTNVTVTGNSAFLGGGIDNAKGATLTLANTIVAGNQATGPTPAGADILGIVSSEGHNLIGKTDGSSGWVGSDLAGTVAKPLAADLSPLGDFGGPTQTIVPLGGSPALGNGSTSLVPPGIATDQRGDPRVVGGKVDIGSVEVQRASPLTITAPASQSAVAGKSASFSLGSFTDPATKGPFTLVVDWGDGSANTIASLIATGVIPVQAHAFKDPGTFVVSFVVADASGNVSNLGTFSVEVAPIAPVTVTVNTAKDQTDPAGSKTVSLRDAVAMANSSSGQVTIRFDPNVFATQQIITLDDPLEISSLAGPIILAGPTAGVTISGGGNTNVLLVDAGVTATFSDVQIVEGAGYEYSAIANFGTLAVVDSTIAGNEGVESNGGGINNAGTLTLVNSTLSGNIDLQLFGPGSKTGYGGALYNSGRATLSDVTITGNSAYYGGGIYNAKGGDLTLANTIVAGDTATGPAPAGLDVFGAVSSKGHNLIGETDGSSGWVSSDLTGTKAKPLNAELSPLGNSGGPTLTVVPLTGSPAIGHGSVSLIPPGITTDQRGDPRTIGGKVDIGAVEI
jgi:hypothetical protein